MKYLTEYQDYEENNVIEKTEFCPAKSDWFHIHIRLVSEPLD